MENAIKYLQEIEGYFRDPQSSEMSYRTAFQNYLQTIFPVEDGYRIQHDPKAISGNKPDFIVLRGQVPILYIEVKTVGEDLNKIERSTQAARYFGYTNLIISDYAEFRFYRNGERYDEPIVLAKVDVKQRSLQSDANNSEKLVRTVKDFVQSQKEPIKHGRHLAKIMGGKAQRIRNNVVAFLDSESTEKDELVRMMRFIKDHLIANFSEKDFADMYAQTLVYGLFAARYSDLSMGDFSRAEARELVPKTNPFLLHFFDHISGASFPTRLEIIVDELCEVFSHADVRSLMEEYFKDTNLFGEEHESPDPVIHFYEDFLQEYDPAKKMEMGVFYTPLPVVRFIVRGIDHILKTEFGVAKGLADNSKTERVVEMEQKNGSFKKTKVTDLHRVQLLDFATGTGTFLNETVSHIMKSMENERGRWNAYVSEDLLPRLNGFELMMASYTIAHLKLAMTLSKSGVTDYKTRLRVFLTNTLDEAYKIPLTSSLFGVTESIALESKLASEVKEDYPIMVVMGNPPYSGISQNKHYTENEAYKVEPGGTVRLQEKKNWLDDDYVKFIRFAERLIEKNGEGIVGVITAHGYIDNPTFRGMRWHLRNTFDSIYVLDLHGNSNKKEVAPDGSTDVNVFDIKTGVSILFGVKKRQGSKAKKNLATVYQADFYGKRAEKFDQLNKSSIESIEWNKLPAEAEVWRVEGAGKEEYMKGFSVTELFPQNTTGIVTMGDSFIVDTDPDILSRRVDDFLEQPISETELKNKYSLGKNYAKWIIDNKSKIQKTRGTIVPFAYKPFDTRSTYFDKNLVWRTREKIMRHFVVGDNVGLVAMRQATDDSNYNHVIVSKNVVDNRFMYSGKGITVQMPLYLYDENREKVPNLEQSIVKRIEAVTDTATPENIFDYTYAVLHSPTYRRQCEEFLKADFPRVPYPNNKDRFWKLAAEGERLRKLHLLEASEMVSSITKFPVLGTNIVEKPVFKEGRVYINESQYWEGVSEEVWKFYIGGYQPAQKYLKDRKGKSLTTAEFENYEKMIVSVSETIKIMEKIDRVMS